MVMPSPHVSGTKQDVVPARQASVQLSRMQADALGMLGHDMAGPLIVIVAASEAILELLDERPDDPAYVVDRVAVRKSLEAVVRQAHRLESIRSDVLATAAADAGTIGAVASTVRVLPFLRASAEHASARVTLTIDCDPDVACVVQPSHLSQMISNLVSNAVRYADQEVTLSASQIEDRVLITVTDDGPGVPAEVMGRLFTRFSHAGAAFRPIGAGSGLGLYIVRTLASANQGAVLYSPGEPGESGTRFILGLPAVGMPP